MGLREEAGRESSTSSSTARTPPWVSGEMRWAREAQDGYGGYLEGEQGKCRFCFFDTEASTGTVFESNEFSDDCENPEGEWYPHSSPKDAGRGHEKCSNQVWDRCDVSIVYSRADTNRNDTLPFSSCSKCLQKFDVRLFTLIIIMLINKKVVHDHKPFSSRSFINFSFFISSISHGLVPSDAIIFANPLADLQLSDL